MKNSKVLIDVESKMSSVSLLEKGVLNEYYVEFDKNELLTGNIYKGRVVNLLNGLQSAFVDIGREKNGFLYVGETLDERPDINKNELIPQKLNLKEGDFVMVQVTKEENDQKGARLTLNISLPGRFFVYLPDVDFTGVSNKITDEATRAQLSELIDKFREKNEGFIARTTSTSCTKARLLDEARELKETFREIKARYDAAGDLPCAVHSEGNLLIRTVRDMLRPDVDSLICNDLATVEALREEFTRKKSRFADLVQYFESDYDMIDVFGIAQEVDKLLVKKVTLPSGGSLIIERTEAFTAIDVNTARFKDADGHEETVYRVNAEAAAEIARQIRLRNIGGIIVIDFIDMSDETHKADIVEILRREVQNDRIKTRVLDMTALGLVELTRKKVGNELSSFLLDICPHCRGGHMAQSTAWVARKMKAGIKKLFADQPFSVALVTAEPSVIAYILENRIFTADCESIWRDKRIYMIPNQNLKRHNFMVAGSNAVTLTLPNDAKLLY